MWLAMWLALTAAPKATCEQLWPRVWAALEKQEFSKGRPPLFDRVTNPKEKLGRAWVAECKRFDGPALACARGERLAQELAALREQLEAEGVPPEKIDAGLEKLRDEWSILECREVNRAVDRAAQQVVDGT